MKTAFVALLGVAGAAAVVWIVNHLAPQILARFLRRWPVSVHVELDPEIVYAGLLNWIGCTYVIPRPIAEIGPAPSDQCREWWRWAWPQGAWDAYGSDIAVTLTGSAESQVLIDGIRIHVQDEGPPLAGTLIQCPVGGASVGRRHLQVDLDAGPAPPVRYVTDWWEETTPFLFSLSKGEVETFHINASAQRAAYRWTAELLLLVDGKRHSVTIDHDGGEFRTTGDGGATSAFMWARGQWSPLRP